MHGKRRLPPDKPTLINEKPPSEQETPRVQRPDRAQRIADNKTTDYVAVKTTLNTFCKRGGRFLPGRALPWEEVLADMSKGVLEAYLLANVHVLRLLKEEKEIPKLDANFFRSCLSAVMNMIRNQKIKGELDESLKVYNASLLRVAGLGYCVSAVPINRSTRTGPIRSCDDYGTLFTPSMIRRVG
ncbi:hypothetical protein P3T76_014170 [Phytophthora citrophthora]|uniref:Uncharacterized protein n=1 Tax=Phytophthora citrophthora TaxID=4793 RepID=A0AAD9G202_9STRA|nr:hypothetical protein P3T76_014170 [Phytophthora citrophthora]